MICRRLARRAVVPAALFAALIAPPPASSQQPVDREQVMRDLRALAWQSGPAEGSIGGIATIGIRDSQAFLDGPNTRRFLELNQNPPRDNHYTLAARESGWFAIFTFENSGYVKDDEKLDPDALLKSLQESDTKGNEERGGLGMPPLHTAAWSVPPHYDAATKRLEWGLRLRTESGREIINYTVRILGRRGVTHATLVSDSRRLEHDIADFKVSLADFNFVAGERYAEFKSGDRMAEYGLGALVLGGAAAVAVKTGFGKAIFKFLIFGLIAFGSAVAAFFRKLFRRG